MKAVVICIMFAGLLFFVSTYSKEKSQTGGSIFTENELKMKAFEILDAKCNACHRKQNPFMIFSLRNMERQSTKVYQQVFIEQRMPKGEQVRLTKEEYETLKNWLLNENDINNGNLD